MAAFASPASAPPRQRQAPPPPSRRTQESERVKKAAVFCADSLSDGWQEAVADRATDYAQTAWERLSRSRRKRNCKALARIARSILDAKAQIHRLIGKLVGWAAGALGAGGAARAFTEELAANIPIGPVDAKMIAVARGVQVAGILLCVMDGRELAKCECCSGTLPCITVAVFRCVAALLLSVTPVAEVWLHCVTSFRPSLVTLSWRRASRAL